MSESDFCDEVHTWVLAEVERIVTDIPTLSQRAARAVWVRKRRKIVHGYVAAPMLSLLGGETERRSWRWHQFPRELDVVIGITAHPDDEEVEIPLIAFELKAGSRLSTDELDKKAGIYRALRELYPLVHTVLLHDDLDQRGMREEFVLRNARYFDTLLWAWHDDAKALLCSLIKHHLSYSLGYWKLAD